MKAIDVLDVVCCNCTPENTYGIYRYFAQKNDLNKMAYPMMYDFMKSYFLGASGVVVSINYEELSESENLIAIYPTMEDDELYHDFMPISEQPLFVGLLDNDQLVYIFSLE